MTDPQPENDQLPMTKSEWAKLHRLVSIGHARLSPNPTGTRGLHGIFSKHNQMVLRFEPPVKAVVATDSQAAPVKGNLTHARLSDSGLDLWFQAEGGRQARSIAVGDVVSVEQVL